MNICTHAPAYLSTIKMPSIGTLDHGILLTKRNTYGIRGIANTGRPANRPAFGGAVPLFYQMSRVPLNH